MFGVMLRVGTGRLFQSVAAAVIAVQAQVSATNDFLNNVFIIV